MRGSGKVKILDAGKTGNLGNGGLSSLKYLPRNARKRLRRHGKRLGKDVFEISSPKIILNMDSCQRNARRSLSLLHSVSRECGLPCLPWCFTSECLSMRGQSPKPFKTSTTECSETPSAARKAAGEKTSSEFPAPIIRPHGTWTLASWMPEGLFFVAAFSVPRMRASVSSVVLYSGMLKHAGTVPQAI